MPDHYDTLGVPKTASSAEIKRAYRRRASKAHPDKHGGDGAEMAALNKAHDVLSNPARRLTYDATGGECDDAPKLNEQVHGMLRQFLAQGLSSDSIDDIPGFARAKIRDLIGAANATAADARQKVRRFEKRRARIKVKQGPNLAHELIDDALNRLKAMAAQADNSIAVARLALEQLDHYECEPDPEAPPTTLTVGKVYFTA